MLARREIDERTRPAAELSGERVERGQELLLRHFLRARPRLQPLGQIAGSRQRRVEQLVRRLELLLRRRCDVEAVAAAHGLRPRDLGARGELGDAGEALKLPGKPPSSLLVFHGLGVLEQRGRLVQQLGRRRRLLGLDRRLQLRRPVVPVDEAVDVLAEPEPEQDVPLSDRVGHFATPYSRSWTAHFGASHCERGVTSSPQRPLQPTRERSAGAKTRCQAPQQKCDS